MVTINLIVIDTMLINIVIIIWSLSDYTLLPYLDYFFISNKSNSKLNFALIDDE